MRALKGKAKRGRPRKEGDTQDRGTPEIQENARKRRKRPADHSRTRCRSVAATKASAA